MNTKRLLKKEILRKILYPSSKVNKEKLAKATTNKTILITGASYGIGEAIAYLLAQKSINLILVARTEEKLIGLKKMFEEQGATVYIYNANLQNMEEVDGLLKWIANLPCEVDIFISNAGKSINRSIEDSLDRFHDFTRTMSLNYYAPVKISLNLIPTLKKNKGQLINISTMNTLFAPPPFWSAYVASKSAFDNWTRSVAPELNAHNVAVTSIYLGLVRTRMIEPTKAYDNMPAMLPEGVANIVCRAIVKRNSRYAPWWTFFVELGSIIFRRPIDFLFTQYIKERTKKRND